MSTIYEKNINALKQYSESPHDTILSLATDGSLSAECPSDPTLPKTRATVLFTGERLVGYEFTITCLEGTDISKIAKVATLALASSHATTLQTFAQSTASKIHDPKFLHDILQGYDIIRDDDLKDLQEQTDFQEQKPVQPRTSLGQFFKNLFTKATPATTTISFDKVGEFEDDSGIDTKTAVAEEP